MPKHRARKHRKGSKVKNKHRVIWSGTQPGQVKFKSRGGVPIPRGQSELARRGEFEFASLIPIPS